MLLSTLQLATFDVHMVFRCVSPFRKHDGLSIATGDQMKAGADSWSAVVGGAQSAGLDHVAKFMELTEPFSIGLSRLFLNRLALADRSPSRKLRDVLQHNHIGSNLCRPFENNPRKPANLLVNQRGTLGAGKVLAIG